MPTAPAPKKPKTLEDMMEETDKMLMKYERIKHTLQLTEILMESISENGEHNTLQMLVSLSSIKKDERVEDMISMFPTLVCMNQFLKKIPAFEVDAETFERLIKEGIHFI